MSAVFSLDQVLASTESANSEYSTTFQCRCALLGRPGKVKFILNGLRWTKTNATITPIRPLPSDSVPLVVINTAATRGRNGNHSRGGGGPVRKDTSPIKKKIEGKPPTENPVWVEVPSPPHGEPRYQTWVLNPDTSL